MQIGIQYPTREVPADGVAIRKFCRAAEDMGFSYMLMPDHVLKCPHEGREPKLNGPYTEKDSFDDPFVIFAFAAAITEKLEFATGVLVLPQRQTALVAQQAADLDRLSNERFRMGVGSGWNYVEYAALGQDFRTRAKRLDEQVDLLRRLWETPVLSFEGRFDRIDRAGINPLPRRRIPVWIGGHSEPAYERGARIGDGFIFAADGADAVEAWQRVRQHLSAFGRDEAAFGRELLAIFARTSQDAADHIRMFGDAGGSHGSFPTTEKGLGNNIDAHIDEMARTKRLIDRG